MARWRPPTEQSSPYITAAGAEALKRQLAELWQLRRSDVVPALSAAAAEGDRSENAEYIYRKKQLAEIDRKIRYLSKRLEEIKVVDRAPGNAGRVYFGAWVEVLDQAGAKREFRIVGADETDAAKSYISIDSPMARALLGHESGDVVTVKRPDGQGSITIIGIRYPQEP